MRDEATAKSATDWKAARRFILWTLAVFAVNAAAQVAAFAAMFAFFQKNYLLAALPTLFALVVLAFQPWLLFLQAIPKASVLAPLIAAIITVLIYGGLDRAKKLEGLKHWARRLLTHRGRLTIGIVCGFIAASVFLGYTDALPQNRGLPRSARYQPGPPSASLQDSRYYVISDFLDSEVVWRVQVPPSDVDAVVKALGMAAVSQDKIPTTFAQKPPLWWRPETGSDARAFSTGNFPTANRGGDGNHVFAVYNPQTERLHVWIKENF